MWHSFGHSLNCDNEFDEMSDLTINTTDIKCRVYVAKFLCAQCLCLHGKLLFLCVSGTNISSWIGEVLFMCWQCLMERRWRISFSATNHARTQVGAFFLLHFPPRSLWMQMFTYICLYCLNGTLDLPAVQLLSVSHILFPFFLSQSFLFLYFPTPFRFMHLIQNDSRCIPSNPKPWRCYCLSCRNITKMLTLLFLLFLCCFSLLSTQLLHLFLLYSDC